MGKLVIGLLLGVAFSYSVAANAENLKLSGNKHWLAVASTKDLDMAIGIARNLESNGARVVSSLSGYYAIVLGPYTGNSIAEVKRKGASIPELPDDSLLSDGARYTGIVWTTPSQTLSMIAYGVDKPAQLSSGDLTVELKLQKVGEDQSSTVVTGTEKGGASFNFEVGKDGEFANEPAEAAFIKLDPRSTSPQLVFTRYSGGAHCCTNTWIAVKPEGALGWSLIDAGKLDGGGYFFEDVDGDGGLELLSVDNRFLYAFDSYAGSYAPLKISKLRGGRIEDVSEEPAMRSRLLQDVASMEFNAKLDTSNWKANGFLAGWLASKIRLGQGNDAWQTVVENYDKSSEFAPQECTTGQSIEDCPPENLKAIPFLKGLAKFLQNAGYNPLPDAAEPLLN
jgi:serine protease Do